MYYLSFFSVSYSLLVNETVLHGQKDVTYVLAWFYLTQKKKRQGGRMVSLLYRNVRTQCKFLQITV